MKNFNIIAITIILVIINTHSHASESTFGLKTGIMINSSAGASNARSLGLFAKIPLGSENTNFELEYATTIDSGSTGGGFDNDWNLTTIAGYFTNTIDQGDSFIKIKFGLLHERVVISDNSPFPFSDRIASDMGLSFGIGTGWYIGKKNKLEIEYTIIEKDISFLSVGYVF